ncbi:N-acetylmuramoyl-L-alanine amidase [Sporichthya sp.]|uniref:peptidoglycan recognition protein family protein n=1 Tax=Sporichthya sp. TaxID=65475 RepID=UPI0017BB270D|nr:N-acetylmuramoyl-L-alanine amidase [Sporichthya sp.]MBA3745845.1 N-acetylmuramoyl-L-alanine amidase [Sporichthya sp.]
MPRITRRRALGLAAVASVAAVAEAGASSLLPAWGEGSGDPEVGVRRLPLRPSDMTMGQMPGEAADGLARMFSPPMAAGPFSMIGLTWDGAGKGTPAPMSVSLRSALGQSWGPWQEVHRDLDAPDGDEDSVADVTCTVPVWVGFSDALQVRIDLPGGESIPAGLGAVLLDPGTSPSDLDADPAVAPVSRLGLGVLAPEVRSRGAWKADPALTRRSPRYTREIVAGFVHHTAGTNNYGPDDVPKILRGVHAYHVRVRGWSDVGYNFLVDRFGRIWEGRAGGVDKRVLGAHTGGFNSRTFGVAAIGTFQSTAPSPAMLTSLAQLIAWKFTLDQPDALDALGSVRLTSEGGGVARYPAGRGVNFRRISGHRDAGSTSCPGDLLYRELPRLRSQVAAAIVGSVPVPEPVPVPIPEPVPEPVPVPDPLTTPRPAPTVVPGPLPGPDLTTTVPTTGPRRPGF